MRIKTLSLKSYDKVYITLDLKQSWTLLDIQEQISAALDCIAGKKLFIISEKTVGSAEYMDFYLDLREKMFADKGLTPPPNTYEEAMSVTKTCMVSIAFYTIAIKNDTVLADYLCDDAGRALGTRLTTRLVTYLYLQNIRLLRLRHKNAEEFKVWNATNDLILKNGFDMKDIVRSSISISEVNRARIAEEAGDFRDYKICSDVVCMKSNAGKPDLNHLQIHYRRTSSYGQLFEDEDCCELLIDGKSKIKKTDSEEDTERQIRRTLENVSLLLEQAGMTYGDILEATCFFKQKKDYLLYTKIVEKMGIGDFCSSYAIHDNTREEFLFELHATAYSAKKID